MTLCQPESTEIEMRNPCKNDKEGNGMSANTHMHDCVFVSHDRHKYADRYCMNSPAQTYPIALVVI
jgi:hypothetical protein